MIVSHGNFDKLAENYNKFRPDYSSEVLKSLINLCKGDSLAVADIGAGTGIWTRMLSCSEKISTLYAVEPSNNMKKLGESHKSNGNINWLLGSAEESNLESESFDLVTMASSFHWANFDIATKEFNRILKNNGIFCALWNPRYIDNNPLFTDIEKKIYELNPKINRVSSGKSEFVESIAEKFKKSAYFTNLQYFEGKHSIKMTREQYIGAWMSVNDIQYQLGDKFKIFMNYVEEKTKDEKFIKSDYITRAWAVKKI